MMVLDMRAGLGQAKETCRQSLSNNKLAVVRKYCAGARAQKTTTP